MGQVSTKSIKTPKYKRITQGEKELIYKLMELRKIAEDRVIWLVPYSSSMKFLYKICYNLLQ